MNELPISDQNSNDLLGYKDLVADTLIGLTGLVESIHYSIVQTTFGQTNCDKKPLRSKIYQSIKSITQITAKATTPLINLIAHQRVKHDGNSHKHQTIKAILNGVVGDHLEKSNNSLAITMQFRRNGQALSAQQLTKIIEESQGKLLILIHGSCMNDLLWRHKEHDHGEQLAKDIGLTPIYLNYNSGLHISENGRQLSLLLESLIESSNQPIELSILAHSMGGLVIRSACYYAEKYKKTWSNQLKKVVFLGTPHHGAPLEKIGNWFEQLLELNSISRHFCKLTGIRSNGITDLRHGYLVDEDWQDPNKEDNQQKAVIELTESIKWFTVAAITNKKANFFNHKLIGDGLVTVTSALGQHKKEEYRLDFASENQWVEANTNHMALLSNANVYLKIKNWLS